MALLSAITFGSIYNKSFRTTSRTTYNAMMTNGKYGLMIAGILVSLAIVLAQAASVYFAHTIRASLLYGRKLGQRLATNVIYLVPVTPEMAPLTADE